MHPWWMHLLFVTFTRMGYIIGTDEAGYGPNLGPLVISATVWEAPDGVGGEGLFERLRGVVANTLPKRKDDSGLPVFADSKILYKSETHTIPRPHHSPHPRPLSQSERGDVKTLSQEERGASHGPFRHLERGLWAALELLGWEAATWRMVWERLAPGSLEVIDGSPFYREFDQKLPRDYGGDNTTVTPTIESCQGRGRAGAPGARGG